VKEQIKEIWRKHKVKIVVGGTVLGGVAIYAITRKKPTAIEETVRVIETTFDFDTIEEALEKFKEIEGAQKLAGNCGEVALFGGYHPDFKVSYTVMDL